MGDVPTRLGSCTDAAELHFLQGPDAQHVALATPATRLHVDSSRGQLCSSALEEQDLSLARLQFHVKMREQSILSVVYPHMFFEQAQSSPPGQGWHQLSKLLRLDSKLFQDCTNCVKDETRPLYHTYLPTYLHTERPTDRQTSIHPYIFRYQMLAICPCMFTTLGERAEQQRPDLEAPGMPAIHRQPSLCLSQFEFDRG